MEGLEFDLKRLIDERHSREAEPFKELIERYNRVSSSYDRVSSQLGETWRLLSTENGEGTIAEKITSMADDLEMAVETEGGDSKLHISYYKREKELQNLRESNEALTMKLLEISEQRATEMNEELLSRRIVENLPKYKRTSDKKGWILHLAEGLVYSPHSSEGTQILDSSICDDFLLTAANDGIVTLARIEMGEGDRDDRKSITLEQNAAVQACDSTISLCHHYSGGKRLLIASCSECSVRIYSLSPSLSMDKGQLLFHFTVPASSRPTSTCFLSPSRLALGTSDGYLRVYDFSGEGGIPRRETNTRLSEGSLLSLSLSTDSTRLAVADSNSRVHVLLFTAGDHSKVSVILDGYETRTGQDAMSRAALSFHPFNRDMLAVTRVGGDSIDIIDVGSGRALRTLVTSSSTHRCLTSGAAWCPTFPGISMVAGVAQPGGGGNSLAVWQVTDSPPQRLSSSTPTRILPCPPSDGGGPITGALWGLQYLAVHNQIGNFFFFT